MEKTVITKDCAKAMLETRFLKVYDLQYAPGKHYYNATRRGLDRLVAVKTDEEFRKLLPDAVSMVVVIAPENEEPRLLLTQEYRYPAGRFLLSVPAGLIDPEDAFSEEPLPAGIQDAPEGHAPLLRAAARELEEETGIVLTPEDRLFVLNPCLFSSPGMTDESNAIVCAVVRHPIAEELSAGKDANGSEQFEGCYLLTADDARAVLRSGRDKAGNFYSVYTWIGLASFTAGLWKE